MITRYGMSDEFDMVALETVNNQYLGGDSTLDCSAQPPCEIDQKVVAMVKAQHAKAVQILTDNRAKLDELAQYLYPPAPPPGAAPPAPPPQQIDKKVVELVRKQHEKAIALLKAHMDKLDALASYLYEKETITGDEFMKILEGDKSETQEVESAEQKLLADEEKDVKAAAEKAQELAILSAPSKTPAPAATEDQQEKNQPPQS